MVAFEIFLHCDIIQITKGGSLLTWLITGSIVHTLLKICIYYYLLGTELLYRLCFNNIALVADKCETEIFCMFIRFWSLTITRFKILYLNIHCCIFTQFLQKKKKQLKLSKGFLFDIKKPTIFYNIQNNFLGKCWKKNYWHFFKVSWLSKKGYTCCKSCKKKISIMILYICLAFQVQQVKI